MKLNLAKLACGAVFLTMAACSTIEVTENYDPSYDFSKLKTYNWVQVEEKQEHELILKQIRIELKEQLAAKGFSIDADNPDFLVAVYGGTEEKVAIHSTNYGYGYGGWYGGGGVDVYQYKEGTLVIDIIDKQSKELIFRSETVTEVDRNISMEKRKNKIREALEKAIRAFPPGAKTK